MSQSETRTNLLLYFQTNRNFIEQKVYQNFKMQCLNEQQLDTINIKKMKQVIIQIFDFNQNQHVRLFYEQIQQNIHDFIKQKIGNQTGLTMKILIQIDVLIEIIIQCIQKGFKQEEEEEILENNVIINNNEFINNNVSNDVQKNIPIILNPQVVLEEHKKIYNKPKIKKKQFNIAAKVSTFLQKSSKPIIKQFQLEKYDMPDCNVQPRYMQIKDKKLFKKQQQPKHKITIQPLNLEYLQNHNKIFRNRLKKIYLYYCSQIQTLGYNATFDRIKQQCQMMNIGKFLIFCKTTQIFQNEKKINRNYLINIYKKYSNDKKQINFIQFQKIIKQLDIQYINLQSKQKQNQNQIPTFQARLGLNKISKYKLMQKPIKLSFSNGNKSRKQFKNKIYQSINKQLTSHSGKTSQDLNLSLEFIKQDNLSQKYQKQIKKKIKQKNRNVSVKKKNIDYYKWPPKDWIITQEDQLYLRDYKNKNFIGDMKKRVNEIQKMESNRY